MAYLDDFFIVIVCVILVAGLVISIFSLIKALQVNALKKEIDRLESRVKDLSVVRKRGVIITGEGLTKEERKTGAALQSVAGEELPVVKIQPVTESEVKPETESPAPMPLAEETASLPAPAMQSKVSMTDLADLIAEVNEGKDAPIIEKVSAEIIEPKYDAEEEKPLPPVEQKPVVAITEEKKVVESSSQEAGSIEYFIGTKIIAWLGGIALFFGLVYFAKYAIDQNMVSPEARVAITYGTGLLLMLGGYLFGRKKYDVLSHTLNAVGVVTLYLATGVASLVYKFPVFTPFVTGMLLLLTTGLAFFVAVRKRSHVVAILGIVGGFVTPILLSTGQDKMVSLFCYITALNIALLGVGVYLRWYYLSLLGVLGTLMLTMGWFHEFWDENLANAEYRRIVVTGYMLVTTLLYLFALIWDRKRRDKEHPFVYSVIGVSLWILSYYMILPWLNVVLVEWTPERWLVGLPIAFISIPLLAHAFLVKIYPRLSWTLLFGAICHLVYFIPIIKSPAYAGVAEMYLLFCGVAYTLIGLYLARRAQKKGAEISSWFLMLFAAIPYLMPEAYLERGVTSPLLLHSIALSTGVMLVFSRIWSLRQVPVFALAGAWFAAGNGINFIEGIEGYWYWLLGTAGFLMLFPFLSMRHYMKSMIPWVASALALPLFYVLVREAVGTQFLFLWEGYPGVIALAYTLPYILALIVLSHGFPIAGASKSTKLALYAGVLIFFVTLAIGEQFQKEWLTIAFALEGLALLFIHKFLRHKGLVVIAFGLLAASFIRFTINPEVLSYHISSASKILNWYLYSYLTVAFCCFFGAGFLRLADRESGGLKIVRGLLSGMGIILLFVLLNLEIADYFSIPGEKTLIFNFDSSLAAKLTYSIGWGVFSLCLFLFGFLKRVSGARIAGMLMLGVTLLKVFLFDLTNLEQLYRVGSLVVLAVVALFVSFLYQKFRSKLPAGEK